MSELIVRLEERAKTLRLPDFAAESEAAKTTQDKVIARVEGRCAAFAGKAENSVGKPVADMRLHNQQTISRYQTASISWGSGKTTITIPPARV